jgi:hypothetical protein
MFCGHSKTTLAKLLLSILFLIPGSNSKAQLPSNDENNQLKREKNIYNARNLYGHI